jgi:hypothetical protein
MKRIKPLLVLFLCLCLPACGDGADIDNNESPVHKDVSVGGVTLKLADCQVHYSNGPDSGTVRLDIPPPCVFAVDQSGNIHRESTEWGWSLIAVNTKQSDDSPDCDTQLQGILVSNGKVISSPGVQRIAACGIGPWDQKLYVVFAAQSSNKSQ